MNDSNSERSKSWTVYADSHPISSSQSGGPWKNLGTSMNALSFGFVATAILISMFLIMAIFEHLFRPNASFSSPQEGSERSFESIPMQKVGDPNNVPTRYGADFSVLMPGQRYPTYIAQPAPLKACSREGRDEKDIIFLFISMLANLCGLLCTQCQTAQTKIKSAKIINDS